VLVSIDELLILFIGQKIEIKYFPEKKITHMDKCHISAIPVSGNDLMHVHDISTFKATKFAPLLDDFWNDFLGDP